MNLPYPRNAAPIVEARMKGMKPAGPLIVVMTDRYQRLPDDAHVFVDAGQAYRWDWARGLDNAVVVVEAATRLGSLLVDLAGSGVLQLDVVDAERVIGWMVCSAEPLRTVRWPKSQAVDWLGDGSWHAGLARAKAECETRMVGKWRYAA
ncbi:hypothetical protein J7E49_06760 [Variovorax paradoxus]|nr:hypothetical protein [Variovorax paradoxus]